MSTGRAPRIGLLSLSHAATDFYQGSIAVLIPFLVYGAGFSYAEATGLVLGATASSSIAQPFFGVLADRRDTYWLIPVSMVVAGLGICLIGVVDSYAWALSMATVSGLGVAAYHPAAARLARQVGGGSAQAMSWFIVGGNVGLALAPLVMAPILVVHGLAATPVLGAFGFVMAIVVVAARRWLVITPTAARSSSKPPVADDWQSFRWLAAVAILRAGIYFGVSSLIGVFVIEELGVDQGAAALTLTAFLAVGAVATVAGGLIADRWRRLASIRLGFALVVPGLLLVVTAPNLPLVVLGAMLTGAGAFLPFSVQTTLGHEYLPNRIGTASGVTIGLSVSAGGAMAPLLGLISDAHGPRVALATLLVLPLLALAASMRLREVSRHAVGGDDTIRPAEVATH